MYVFDITYDHVAAVVDIKDIGELTKKSVLPYVANNRLDYLAFLNLLPLCRACPQAPTFLNA